MAARHLVIFSALYMPHLGGVEKFSQSIAAELSHDCTVSVFCMNTETRPARIQEGRVSVFFLPCFPLLHGRFPIPKPQGLRTVREYFRENPVDFAIVQCRFYLLSAWACRFLGQQKIPFIQMEHGAGEVLMPNPVMTALWHIYENTLTALEKKVSHDFYAVSHAGLRWLEHFGIRGKGVISNSINPADFTAALADPRAWRHERGISEDTFIISFSGRIMREKGITDLLEAFDRLHGENLLLVCAGGGDFSIVEPWKNRENIRFLGQLDFREIPALMADSQIYCLPSRFVEGKPTSVIEAGYCKAAVISTNTGGTVELIPSREFGLTVPPADVPALTEALQYLIDHPEKRKSMGEALHTRIAENFTWETASRQIREIMQEKGL